MMISVLSLSFQCFVIGKGTLLILPKCGKVTGHDKTAKYLHACKPSKMTP